jgi:hypothetical protein
MPVHLRSVDPTAKAWDAPRCTALRLPLGHGLWLQAGRRWLVPLQQAAAALHREVGEQQLLKVIGAVVQAHLPQCRFRGLHHGNHQAVAAGGALPGLLRRDLQRRSDRLYGADW